jgi:hypothetical protein
MFPASPQARLLVGGLPPGGGAILNSDSFTFGSCAGHCGVVGISRIASATPSFAETSLRLWSVMLS